MTSRFERFTQLMAKINYLIKQIKANEVEGVGLKGSHVMFIHYLSQGRGNTAKELAILCNEDKAAISRTLNFLAEKEYVVLDGKKYKAHILLTEKGNAVAASIEEKVKSVLLEVEKVVSCEDRETMYKSLHSIFHVLEESCN